MQVRKNQSSTFRTPAGGGGFMGSRLFRRPPILLLSVLVILRCVFGFVGLLYSVFVFVVCGSAGLCVCVCACVLVCFFVLML